MPLGQMLFIMLMALSSLWLSHDRQQHSLCFLALVHRSKHQRQDADGGKGSRFVVWKMESLPSLYFSFIYPSLLLGLNPLTSLSLLFSVSISLYNNHVVLWPPRSDCVVVGGGALSMSPSSLCSPIYPSRIIPAVCSSFLLL